MKVTSVEAIPVDAYLFVKIHTDEGITGLGQAGKSADEGSLERFSSYLVGQDPLRIEHHWQYMYRSGHFRGAGVMGAIGALDIAL